MAKIREAIGLDIGAQAVKMVRVDLKGNSVRIVDYKIEDRAVNIRDMLKDVGKEIPVVSSVEGSNIFIRVFKLPGVARSKLAKIIAYEAQQQVPFPIDEVVWSYQSLRRVSAEETDVVLTAVRVNIVRDLLGSLGIDAADVIPPVVGLNNLLEYNGYETIQDPSGQAVMVLDLGAKTTNVIIVEKQNLWFRTIPIGGEVITQALCSEYGINYTNAELLKKEKGEVILEGEAEIDQERRRISTCIIKSLTRLTSEITRSIEVYSSNFNSLGPRKIFITGGGAGLRNIGDFFNKKFRSDVSMLSIGKRFIMKEGPSQDAGRIGTALGLAIQGFGLGRIRLSLLPKEVLDKYKWLNRQPYIAAVSGLLVFLGICFSGYNVQMSRIYKANTSKMGNEIKALDLNKRKLLKLQEDLTSVKYKMDIINAVKYNHIFWLETLLGLEGLLPNNTWFTGIEPKGEAGLIIRGKTLGTYEDVITFRNSINDSRYFIKDSCKVISANPPVDGIRDFVIEGKRSNESL